MFGKKDYFLASAVLLISILLVSCGEDGSGPAGGESATDLETEGKYEVTYSDETVIISEENYVSMDTTTNELVLSAGGIGQMPEAGSVILVEGKALRKVTGISQSGGQIILRTEDANLTDAIENGVIEWDITPTWDQVGSIKIGGKDQDVIKSGPDGILVERTIEMGDYKYNIKVTPEAAGGEIRSATFEFGVAKSVGGKYTAAFTAEGTVKLPQQKSSIQISGGELDRFKTVNNGINSDIKLKVSVAGGTGGETSLELPNVAISIPIRYIPTPSGPVPNPIPMTIDVGVQFVTKLTIPTAEASAQLETNLSLNSDTGLEYKGTEINTEAKVNNENIGSGTFDAAATIGIPVDAQFGVAFPRVSLNIIGQEVAFVHLGFTSGASLEWGPVCKKGYAKLLVQGGYELSILGKTLAEGDKIFYENQKKSECE